MYLITLRAYAILPGMSTIDLYNFLKQIPNVTDEQARQAADAATQPDRLSEIEKHLASLEIAVTELKTTQRFLVAMLLAVLVLQLQPFFS